MPKNVWIKLVLQYIAEFAALSAFTALGFAMDKSRRTARDDVEGLTGEKFKEQGYASGSPSPAASEGVHQVPISYVPQHHK